MATYALVRFTSPNAGVLVNQAATDQYIAAAYGQALKNLDVNALGLAIANAATAAFTLVLPSGASMTFQSGSTLTASGSIDASAASDTAGLKLPSKAGAAPTADGFLAFDTTLHVPAFGLNGATAHPSLWMIADTTLGAPATNVTFSSIPGTYKNLRLAIQSRGDGAVTFEGVLMQFNGDTAGNYDREFVTGNNVTVAASPVNASTSITVGSQPGASATRAAIAGAIEVFIPNYAGTTFEKSTRSTSAVADSTAANCQVDLRGGSWRSTAAITSIKLFPVTSTNFVTGTRVTLYAEV